MNPILMSMLMQLLGLLVGELGKMIIEAITKLSTPEVSDRVANLAVEHVRVLMDSILEGPARRKAAFDGIKQNCLELGIEAKDWLINQCIEAAVGKLKVDALPQ